MTTNERLLQDIDRADFSCYGLAQQKSILLPVVRYLAGKRKNVEKWKLMDVLEKVAVLYKMTLVYNERTGMAYLHVKDAPRAYNNKETEGKSGVCVMTMWGTYTVASMLQNFYRNLEEFRVAFIEKYEDEPVFKASVETMRNVSINP